MNSLTYSILLGCSIALSTGSFSTAIYSKKAVVKKIGFISTLVFVMIGLLIRFMQAGMGFITKDLTPVLTVTVALVLGYFILDYLDKKYPSKEDNVTSK